MTLPDPMQEFRVHLRNKMGLKLLNANKPFTHLSKFIFIDAMSINDNGSKFDNSNDHTRLDNPDARR